MPQAPEWEHADDTSLVALGSNATSTAGLPAETLRAALRALGDAGLRIDRVSRFYRSPAFPAGAGADFVNAAVRLRGTPPPEALLAILHKIEASLGRNRTTRWGPRTLDLDLLAMGQTVLPDSATVRHWIDRPPEAQRRETPDRLLLPHPRLQDRGFVLLPLAEIAPEWRHPILRRTVQEMADALPAEARLAVNPL